MVSEHTQAWIDSANICLVSLVLCPLSLKKTALRRVQDIYTSWCIHLVCPVPVWVQPLWTVILLCPGRSRCCRWYPSVGLRGAGDVTLQLVVPLAVQPPTPGPPLQADLEHSGWVTSSAPYTIQYCMCPLSEISAPFPALPFSFCSLPSRF